MSVLKEKWIALGVYDLTLGVYICAILLSAATLLFCKPHIYSPLIYATFQTNSQTKVVVLVIFVLSRWVHNLCILYAPFSTFPKAPSSLWQL